MSSTYLYGLTRDRWFTRLEYSILLQYQGLFGATRIPEVGKDRIYRTTESTHISVMRNGHIYAVNVLDGEGIFDFSTFH